MLQEMFSVFESKSKCFIAIMGLFWLILVGIGDYVTGWEFQLGFFYILPVVLLSWSFDQRAGIFAAITCAIVWFVVNRLGGLRYSSDMVALWNALMWGGVLIAVSYIVAQLKSKLDRITEAANKDFLTGLPNGRAFYELAACEMEKAFGLKPLALAYIDIEGFKWINHRFGYATGDQMLCSIAQTIRAGVVRGDLVGRIGGTAFAVLMPNTTSDGANFILEKIHQSLKDERRRYAQPVNFFISAVACTKAPRTVAELMHQAETSMTRMKGNNRDVLEVIRVDSVPPLN